jgi:hypothetical protein
VNLKSLVLSRKPDNGAVGCRIAHHKPPGIANIVHLHHNILQGSSKYQVYGAQCAPYGEPNGLLQ